MIYLVIKILYYWLSSFDNFDASLYCFEIIRKLLSDSKNLTDFLIGIVKNMFRLLDKWGRRIRGKPITLNEIFICIAVIVSVIFGIIQIKRTKVMSFTHAFINADESELDYDDKEKFKNDKLWYDLKI